MGQGSLACADKGQIVRIQLHLATLRSQPSVQERLLHLAVGLQIGQQRREVHTLNK